MMFDLKSPEARSPEYIKDKLPALRRASDIMYGVYKLYREDEPINNLRYVLIPQIINPLTQRLIMLAPAPDSWSKVVKWPGIFFGMGEDDDLDYDEAGAGLLGEFTSSLLSFGRLVVTASIGIRRRECLIRIGDANEILDRIAIVYAACVYAAAE